MTAGDSAASLHSRVWIRRGFIAYAAALFVATHWPQLELRGLPIERPDIVVHVAVFFVWTALLGASELLGPWRAGRTVLIVAVVAAVYAAFDEGLQAIPFICRYARWDDFLANLGGVALAVIALRAFAVFAREGSRTTHQ